MKNLLKLTALFVIWSSGALQAVHIYLQNNISPEMERVYGPIKLTYASKNPPIDRFKNIIELKSGEYIDLSTLPGDHSSIYITGMAGSRFSELAGNYNTLEKMLQETNQDSMTIIYDDNWFGFVYFGSPGALGNQFNIFEYSLRKRRLNN